MSFEQRLHEIQGDIQGNAQQTNQRKSRAIGIFMTVGFVGGMALAFKKHKGFWGYAGYSVGGLLLGGFAGRIFTLASAK